jgi:cytosine/adenosine deaminase-related metal-dependent hydrolase
MEAFRMQFENNRDIAGRVFGAELGILRENACADIITLDYDPLTPMNRNNLAGHAIFGMSGYQVRDTMINGRFVMKDRILTTIDLEKTMEKSREVSKRLWERL